jgi:hypothetical protein
MLLPVDEGRYPELLDVLLADGLVGEAWAPFPVRVVAEENGQPLVPADILDLAPGALAFTSMAASRVAEVLEDSGEFLGLHCDGLDVVLFHPATVDALDEAASELEYFEGTAKVMMIHEHAFRRAAIEAFSAFKLPRHQGSRFFVTDRFLDAVDVAGLTGLAPRLVWEG